MGDTWDDEARRVDVERFDHDFDGLPSYVQNALAWGMAVRRGHRVPWEGPLPTIEDVRALSDNDILAMRNLGKKALASIRVWLAEH